MDLLIAELDRRNEGPGGDVADQGLRVPRDVRVAAGLHLSKMWRS